MQQNPKVHPKKGGCDRAELRNDEAVLCLVPRRTTKPSEKKVLFQTHAADTGTAMTTFKKYGLKESLMMSQSTGI